MEVVLNGDTHSLDQECTLNVFINQLELDGKFAIEINEKIIPRSEYDSTPIRAGDHIEIVQAIGGG